MATPLELTRHLSRFKHLPRRDDVWQGAIVSLPTWVDGPPGQDPYRPQVGAWVSTKGRAANLAIIDPAAAHPEEGLLAALAETGTSKNVAFRPSVIQVRDADLARALAAPLADTDTMVEAVERLPALDTLIRHMADAASEDLDTGALAAPGVTVDRLRAFAAAASAFYEAAPWRHLDDGDLVRIEAPKAARGLSLFCVMGSGGREFGLSFFASEGRYRSLFEAPSPEAAFGGGAWSVWFSPGWEIPPADLYAWDEHHLPVASPVAYPVAVRLQPGGDPVRADAQQLAYLEGLLRVLAATTEPEMDSGRWSRTAETFDGPVAYTLRLPDLLAPAGESRPTDGVHDRRSMERATAEISRALAQMSFEDLDDVNKTLRDRFAGISLDDLPSTATTPLDQAQDLIYEAMDARGRRQLQLIRRALELSPDCADAYVLLSERSSDPGEQRSYYEQAVAAGERALGPAAFTDSDRSFWGDVSTRPYMRARFGLADSLAGRGETTAAIEHFQALLQLNPNDNQGARYRILSLLLAANRSDEAEAVLGAYDEASAHWCYAGVLAALKRDDRGLALARLRAALRANRHVPRYLTGQRDLPDPLPEEYMWGSNEEAALCAADLIVAWAATPGAAAWLKAKSKSRTSSK